jgi:hypothetical protein
MGFEVGEAEPGVRAGSGKQSVWVVAADRERMQPDPELVEEAAA